MADEHRADIACAAGDENFFDAACIVHGRISKADMLMLSGVIRMDFVISSKKKRPRTPTLVKKRSALQA
jgi:hypothetical protein